MNHTIKVIVCLRLICRYRRQTEGEAEDDQDLKCDLKCTCTPGTIFYIFPIKKKTNS